MKQMNGIDVILERTRTLASIDLDPRTALVIVYDVQIELCDILELIADSLPERHDRDLCAKLADILGPLILQLHRFEEETLFPSAQIATLPAEAFSMTINRFRSEHSEDEYRLEELSDLLRELSYEREPGNPEAAGYLLRSVFEAIRRHCDYEREYLTHLLGSDTGPGLMH